MAAQAAFLFLLLVQVFLIPFISDRNYANGAALRSMFDTRF